MRSIWKRIRRRFGVPEITVTGHEVDGWRWSFGVECGGKLYLMDCYFRRPGDVNWFLSTATYHLVMSSAMTSCVKLACIEYLDSLDKESANALRASRAAQLNSKPVVESEQ